MGDFLNTTDEGIKGFDAINSSSGTSDAGKMIKTNSEGKIDSTLLVEDDSHSEMVELGEALSSDTIHTLSQYVDTSDNNKVKVKRADRDNDLDASYIYKGTGSDGDTIKVFRIAVLEFASSLTDGSDTAAAGDIGFLGTLSQVIALSGPDSGTKVWQIIGRFSSDTKFYFNPQPSIKLGQTQ